MLFKVGEKVKAIRGDEEWGLVKGKIYVIEEVRELEGNIKLVGLKSRWMMDRFVVV